MQKVFLSPLVRDPGTRWVLRNTRNGRVIADHLIAAVDSKSRRTGLLGRTSFEHGHALIIAPSNAIHTCFMRFAIDIAFVRRDGRIVGTRHALRPWRLAAAFRAYAVIELPAGTLARCETGAGDALEIAAGVLLSDPEKTKL